MGQWCFRRFVLIALPAFVFLTSGALPASAGPLVSVRLQGARGGATRVVLLFSGSIPQYSLYGNGSPDVAILLSDTQRSGGAPSTLTGSGNLRTVTIDSVGNNVSLGLHLSAPATVRVLPGNGPTLIVEIPNGGASASPSPSPQPFSSSYATPPPSRPKLQSGGRVVEVVPLKYADVSEIVGVLVPGSNIASNDTFAPQPSSFGTGQLNSGYTGQATPAFTTSVQTPGETGAPTSAGGGGGGMGERVSDNIAIDRRLNAIILSGTLDEIAPIIEMIQKLDVPLQSVVLETQIVELTDSAAKDLGIDFTAAGGPTATATYTIKNLNQPEITVGLQAALFAEIKNGKGWLIAKPRIVAQSGTQASILTGDALPIVTSIISPGVNAVSQQVQYINVGVSLQIEPRISADGFVTSHIYSEVSSVTGFTQNYPTISQRQAQTIATVKDGQPFIIGGLLQQSQLSNVAKVPGLGDLPLVGGLFRVRHDTSENTNLYIIVTPHIVAPVPNTQRPNQSLAAAGGAACIS
jgi:general secretion pathway protein D